MMRSSDGGGMVVARDREERGVGYCMRWGPRMILMRRRMRFEGFWFFGGGGATDRDSLEYT